MCVQFTPCRAERAVDRVTFTRCRFQAQLWCAGESPGEKPKQPVAKNGNRAAVSGSTDEKRMRGVRMPLVILSRLRKGLLAFFHPLFFALGLCAGVPAGAKTPPATGEFVADDLPFFSTRKPNFFIPDVSVAASAAAL